MVCWLKYKDKKTTHLGVEEPSLSTHAVTDSFQLDLH